MGQYKQPPNRNKNRREQFLNHDPERPETVEPVSTQDARNTKNPYGDMKRNKTIRIKHRYSEALRREVNRLWEEEGISTNESALIDEALTMYFKTKKIDAE